MNHSAQQCLAASKGVLASILEALRTIVDSKYPKTEVNWYNLQASYFGQRCEVLGHLYAMGQTCFSTTQSMCARGVTVKGEMADRTVCLSAKLTWNFPSVQDRGCLRQSYRRPVSLRLTEACQQLEAACSIV